MDGNKRRQAIIDILKNSLQPVSGTYLAKTLQVSRQVIVQDIALLRAGDYDIYSTHKGYVLNTSPVTFEVKETGDIQTATMFNTKPLEDVPNTSKKTGIFYTVGTIITLIGVSILAIYLKKSKTLG